MSLIVNNALNSLIREGNDAQSNLYRLKFSGGYDNMFGDKNLSDSITIRNSGITLPMPSQDSYTVKYITAYIDRPVTKVNLDRHFDIEFRVDSHWNIYRKLLEQQRLFSNAAKSFSSIYITDSVGNILEDKFFNVTVEYINELSESSNVDNEDNLNTIAEYRHSWIESITPPSFSTGDASPVTISCSINFMEMIDYQSRYSTAARSSIRTKYV